MRKVFLFTVVLQLSLLFLILFFIERFERIDFALARYTPFSGIFPNSNPTMIEEKGWKGYTFKEGLRIFYSTTDNPDSILEEYKSWYIQREKARVSSISMGNKAIIVLRSLRKGYTAIWCDFSGYSDNLDRYRFPR